MESGRGDDVEEEGVCGGNGAGGGRDGDGDGDTEGIGEPGQTEGVQHGERRE